MEDVKPREYEHRVQQVEQKTHANFQHLGCQERRVMAILHKISIFELKENINNYVFGMFSRLATMLERFLEAKSCI